MQLVTRDMADQRDKQAEAEARKRNCERQGWSEERAFHAQSRAALRTATPPLRTARPTRPRGPAASAAATRQCSRRVAPCLPPTRQHATLTGDTDEHRRVRTLLNSLGPAGLLKRLQEPGGAQAVEEELLLRCLTIEVGRRVLHTSVPLAGLGSSPRLAPTEARGCVPLCTRQVGLLPIDNGAEPEPGVKAKGRAFMRVRDLKTSEVCLEWAAPGSTRSTDPSKQKEGGKLSRKLHDEAEA